MPVDCKGVIFVYIKKEVRKNIDFKLWIRKCSMLVLKRGKIIKSQKIKEDDGELIKEIEEEVYEYLGVIEAEKWKKPSRKNI